MHLLKIYNYKIIYHSDKKNVVVDTLSRKDSAMLAQLMVSIWRILKTIRDLKISHREEGAYLT